MNPGEVAPQRIEVSNRRILAIAIPMTLSSVTTPLIGLTDTTIMGRMGQAHVLGAVALGAVLFDFLFWSFGSLRMATAGLTAQAVGAGDRSEVDRTLARALVVAMVVGFAFIVMQWPIGSLAFRCFGASDAVISSLSKYFYVRIWSAPFVLANYVILGSTLGRGRTDLGLLLQIAINLANIGLTIFLVVWMGFGIEGAAFGNGLAEVIGTGLGILVLRRLGSNPFRVARSEVFERTALFRALSLNGDIFIRTVFLILTFWVFSAQGAQAGDVALAANAVLYNMFLIGGYFLDGFATAAETLCGQSLGAKDEGGFRRSVKLCLLWSVGFGLSLSLLMMSGGWFIDFVSTNIEVREYARRFLLFASLTPLFGAVAFTFDGIFIGATWTKQMRNLMILSFVGFLLTLIVAKDFGNSGLWVALLLFLLIRGLGQASLSPRLIRRAFA